ncbi:aspartate aminotransferase family protein [Pseudomonas sp. MWU12-2534b]|nr:aspartate aminotransferase family protein [Pseudomonas sp. MWU12-2534b]
MSQLFIRDSPARLSPEEFSRQATALVAILTTFLRGLEQAPLKTEHSARVIKDLLGPCDMPEKGRGSDALIEAAHLLCQHGLSTSNPRFWGYIMGAAAPIAGMADLLAGVISAPMTSYSTSALTVALEAQAIRWVSELLGYDVEGSGLFLSGGSMANFCALRLALQARSGFDVRTEGLASAKGARLRIYATREAHSSLCSAVEMAGLGTRAVSWVSTMKDGTMDVADLQKKLLTDIEQGLQPLMVMGLAGSTSTGTVDPIEKIAELCRQVDAWFHVDAAYGGFAVLCDDVPVALRSLITADSLAIDPHKWLYMPADVGCLLSKHRNVFYDTFHQGADYYADNDQQQELGGKEVLQFRDMGPQTTRAFRALKVYIALQAIGRTGYKQMISDDINLARKLHTLVSEQAELEAISQRLSITTFRYIPANLKPKALIETSYINRLNQQILAVIQASGRFYPSQAVIDGLFVIRVCIVNFNTNENDIALLPQYVVEIGRDLHQRQSEIS